MPIIGIFALFSSNICGSSTNSSTTLRSKKRQPEQTAVFFGYGNIGHKQIILLYEWSDGLLPGQ